MAYKSKAPLWKGVGGKKEAPLRVLMINDGGDLINSVSMPKKATPMGYQ